MPTDPEPTEGGLPEPERRRIIEEERLRRRIREDLEASGGRSKVLSFFNSPLGLLIVSSVAVTGVGALYTERQAQLRENEAKRQQLGRLIIEHNYRASQAAYYARDITNPQSPTRSFSCTFLWRAVQGDREFQPTAPEFRNLRWLGVVSQIGLIANIPIDRSATNLVALENFTTNRCADRRADPLMFVRPLQCFTGEARSAVGEEADSLPWCPAN